MKTLFALLLTTSLLGCASKRPSGAEIGPRVSQKEYESRMKSKTQVDKHYDGFHQLYETYVTFVDSDVQALVLQRKSDVYQWDMDKAQQEREKMFQENSSQSKFFVVLFTPRRRLAHMDRKHSIWKVYLDLGAERYEAKIKKAKGQQESIRAIYPSLNRFSEAFEISFDVPMQAVEDGEAKFILTSSLGTSELKF